MHSQTLPCRANRVPLLEHCSARLHACRESDRLPAQHTEQTHVSKTAPRHAGMQEKQGDARDTYVTHSDTNRSQIRSQITIWDLPEASGSPGTGTSWRRQCGWGSVPSPDGTHLCSQEVTRHTTHIWQGSFTTELKPVLLQLGLSSPAQADTHAPVYRLQSHFCSTGRWTDCAPCSLHSAKAAHSRPGCRPKSCCHQTGHQTDLD